MFNTIMFVFQIGFALLGLYQLFLTFFGWSRKKEDLSHAPQKKFALLIAAHNEEQVVGALIENLLKMKYPRELYDIFVICDNCTDGTVKVVNSYDGVYACERVNTNQRGKGYAVEWMLKELWKMPKNYDGVCIFDADNLVATDFLQYMNNDLCNGNRVIQGYLDTKNPNDSWVSSANAINYWFCNRLWQLPRTNLKLANFLGGTGMCFEAKLLKEMGWGATSLVEDLEFTVRCIKKGIYPKFNFEAKVFDEKPITFQASARQRLRWMQGHFDVTRKYMLPLLWQGIKEGSWTKIDAALYVFNAYNYLAGFFITTIVWGDIFLSGGDNVTSVYNMLPIWLSIPYMLYIFTQIPLSMYMAKVDWKLYLRIPTFLLFTLSWWPITVHAFFTQNNKKWSHTQHTRVIRLEEVQSKQL
ncbi:glycosyltransferase family 2 protein [Paenibacillus radicis (ex Gao et al. 2016)]|uniref:Glycosyl transferase family 2 n=1 Tax=Paenibacillus radicis (ex Gao et al. 2016) TaxID=1737354 RepID=A0A917M4U4_9BACL|nr:glycosyltransferase family 2 protein [Paenibacillus radicis (ex Gao et al. 2016)]GGG77043.1 glycosyl transferase family 2 [Paenibacillus radicis (ex Gao et al. 2016)]